MPHGCDGLRMRRSACGGASVRWRARAHITVVAAREVGPASFVLGGFALQIAAIATCRIDTAPEKSSVALVVVTGLSALFAQMLWMLPKDDGSVMAGCAEAGTDLGEPKATQRPGV